MTSEKPDLRARGDYELNLRSNLMGSRRWICTLRPNDHLLDQHPDAPTLYGVKIAEMRRNNPDEPERERSAWTVIADSGQPFSVPSAFIWRVMPQVGGWLLYKPQIGDDIYSAAAGYLAAERVAAFYTVEVSQ